MTIIMNEEFMNQALKRVNELQQELIEESKKIVDSEMIVNKEIDSFMGILKGADSLDIDDERYKAIFPVK